ncbi:MAG: peptidase M50 [Rubrivivax sp.]|nr:MAG: peptidase M50 [Rubrivivax sp.]
MQALFSEHWHAVRNLRPRLREGVEALHRRLRGLAWVLLFDPVTHRFHRLTPQVYRIVQLLDGRRTLDEVWMSACADTEADADAAVITQHELVQLLSQLHASDLLQTQVSPDAAEVFERYQRQRRTQWRQTWLNPLSIKLPLFYPDAWFERWSGLAKRLFSGTVLMLWLLLVTPAAVLGWQHWDALTNNLSDRVLSAQNLVLLWFTYPAVKAVHEWAHGMAVKAWGGAVREVGLMLIVFTPVPYVDATASYRFPSKWARAAVAAAGIMAELALGAVAVYVWLMAEPGLLTAIAFNVILIAGVSTVVVNGNPLMRYDGYFIFCDLVEIPNLSQRATQYWTYLVDRYGFRSTDATPPIESRGEEPLLFFYGAVAPIYRFLVSLGLVWFIASEYFLFGVILALAGAWTALVMPLWKAWKHVSESASLGRRRDAAVRQALGLAVALVALLVALPMPFYSVHEAVVWLPDEAIVRAGESGHIDQVLTRAGQELKQGQALLHIDNLQMQADLASAQAAAQRSEARLRQAQSDEPAKVDGLKSELASQVLQLKQLQEREHRTWVTAGLPGHWAPAQSTELAGRYVKRGEVLGYAVSGPSKVLRVAVTQEDMDLVRARLKQVDVRLANKPAQALSGRVVRKVPGGNDNLVSPALGSSAGGAIPVDPAKAEGVKALRPVFDMEVALDQALASDVFGDRAYVRFDLGAMPLAGQWFIRLRQMFLARLYV